MINFKLSWQMCRASKRRATLRIGIHALLRNVERENRGAPPPQKKKRLPVLLVWNVTGHRCAILGTRRGGAVPGEVSRAHTSSSSSSAMTSMYPTAWAAPSGDTMAEVLPGGSSMYPAVAAGGTWNTATKYPDGCRKGGQNRGNGSDRKHTSDRKAGNMPACQQTHKFESLFPHNT